MPIYEYECPVHGIHEKVLPLSYADEKSIPCTLDIDCEERCERIWSIPGNKNLQCAKPTIVFKNPRTGELRVATHDNDRPPAGFISQELRGPIERSKFEREASQRRYVEDELTTEKLKQGREQTAKNIHDDVNARMNSVTNKVYNPETKQDENVVWDEQTKAMLKMAMKRTRKKHEKIKPKRTNVRLDVNHIDSSNLIK